MLFLIFGYANPDFLMKSMKKILSTVILLLGLSGIVQAKPLFKALAIYENGGNHLPYSKVARVWLDSLAKKENFEVDYVNDTRKFNPEFLTAYQLIIQLDYPPYAWKDNEKQAFKDYIEKGKGGWIGFHHATLLGDFDGYKMWPWFSGFMGNITFKTYIPDFAQGGVVVEKTNHPVFKGIPKKFLIKKEEWYTYNKSPREHVNVLASVDENTYQPSDVPKMGDHPVIWTNEKMKARNIYIFMGHGSELFQDKTYQKLFQNAIFWASKPYLK